MLFRRAKEEKAFASGGISKGEVGEQIEKRVRKTFTLHVWREVLGKNVTRVRLPGEKVGQRPKYVRYPKMRGKRIMKEKGVLGFLGGQLT